MLEKFFSEVDPQHQPAPRKPAPLQSTTVSRASDGKTKSKKKRSRWIAPCHIQTVAAAAEWIDTVTGSPHLPKESSSGAAVFHMWKRVELSIRALRIANKAASRE
jgi:hypothetical protein